MAKDETRRWRGWRTGGVANSEITGSQPKLRPGTKRKKKLSPWYWVTARKNDACKGCGSGISKGQVVAVSRPKKTLCLSCVEGRGLKPKVSAKLKEERRERVIATLREKAR